MLRDIEKALRLTESDAPREASLAGLRDAAVTALTPYLWPRIK